MKSIGNAWLIIALLFVGFAAPSASADEDDQVDRIVVSYGDLDLSVAAGTAALYQRLKLAAWRVCNKPEGGFGDQAAWLLCYHAALAHAVRDVGNTKITALYNRENKVRIHQPGRARAMAGKTMGLSHHRIIVVSAGR